MEISFRGRKKDRDDDNEEETIFLEYFSLFIIGGILIGLILVVVIVACCVWHRRSRRNPSRAEVLGTPVEERNAVFNQGPNPDLVTNNEGRRVNNTVMNYREEIIPDIDQIQGRFLKSNQKADIPLQTYSPEEYTNISQDQSHLGIRTPTVPPRPNLNNKSCPYMSTNIGNDGNRVQVDKSDPDTDNSYDLHSPYSPPPPTTLYNSSSTVYTSNSFRDMKSSNRTSTRVGSINRDNISHCEINIEIDTANEDSMLPPSVPSPSRIYDYTF